MISGNHISLVMPCRNEAKALQTVLQNMPGQIDEVIVVDNNSSDQTRRIAKSFGARVITEPRMNKSGIGYGFALQKGIEKSKGQIVACMDGDGSYPIEEIPNLVESLINERLDFISCNRLPFKNPKEMSLIRSSGVRVLNLLAWILFSYRIKDSLSGMWIFKRVVYKELSPSEGGWNFSLEIKLRAISDPRFRFAEKQIPYHDRVLDLSKQKILRTGIEHLIYLFTLRFKLFRYGLNLNSASATEVFSH